MDDYIYLFKLEGKHWFDHPRLFKIGLSGEPDQRLWELQRAWLKRRGRNVSAVKITRVWDMRVSEARLHEMFKDDNVYARNHPVFTGQPISGDTEWHHLPWPWDVAAVVRAMEGESRWAKVWDYGLPIVGFLLLACAIYAQLAPKQLPPARQSQSETTTTQYF